MSTEQATSTADWAKIPTARGEYLEDKRGIENGSYDLWELEVGDVVHVVAGNGDSQYIYDFCVRSAASEPTVTLKQTGPDGSIVYFDDYEITLRGSGSWVGREWPLHKYSSDRSDGKQILIDYGALHVGGEIVLFDPKRPSEDRMAILQPAISTIELIKSETE